MDCEFRELKKGDVLVKEGTQSSDVYLLSEGSAEVWKEGVKIGAIGTNEIFGVIGALTSAPRTASVICGSDTAFAMIITREQFQGLIREKPELVEKLLVDLCRNIENLNCRYVELSKRASV
jgi:CRP/FNR family cyclic AMP-dependent transcriptional regulator